MAPSLSALIRQELQRREVPPQNITSYLEKIKTLPRYNRSFKSLWAMAGWGTSNPNNITIQTIASQIQKMSLLSPSEARHAYSGILLVPGMESLRFSPLLKQCKREWSASIAKYSDFWDAKRVLDCLQAQPLNWHSVQSVRDRLIIVMRLLHLCRSVDLAQTYRSISFQEKTPYILMKRKGQQLAQWERLIVMGQKPLCPTQLLLKYVSLTAVQCLPGSPLIRAVTPPFHPLTANSVGRITKNILQKLGVPMNIFGPHSTRGASVKMYKSLGLTSEIVCELGKWKNAGAFTSHYLRLGAAEVAGEVLSTNLVHTVSSWGSAEPERSPSPRMEPDLGRGDLEGGAQRQDEPTLPTPLAPRSGCSGHNQRVRDAGGSPPLKFRFAANRLLEPTAGNGEAVRDPDS